MAMRHGSFLAVSPAGLVVDTVTTETDRIMITAHPRAQDAACPGCGMTSAQIHSHYERRLLDLPSHGRAYTWAFRSGGSGAAIVIASDRSSANRYRTAQLYGRQSVGRNCKRSSTLWVLLWAIARVRAWRGA
jgi:hypothetical protein